MPPLNIAIVGGGIGGPAAAISLALNGHNVTLYERNTSIGGVGFAFRITPNSDLCLKFLGIDTKAGGAVIANTVRMMNSEGEVIAEIKENIVTEKAKKGTSVFAYRPSLQQQLLERMTESGAHTKTGVKVTSVNVAQSTISFDDSATVSADVIIAADGIHSCIRPHIIDSSQYFPKASSGHGCLRFTIPKKTVLDDPIASRIVNEAFRMFTWRGEGKYIIVYPVDYDRQFNFNCTHPEELSSLETSGGDSADAIAYNQKISPETVHKIYQEFDEVALRLLELADPDGFRVWKLMDMDEIPRWSAGRTVLLGDACHPVLPFGFSGASMAIEDAVTLATLLPSGLPVEEIEDRLQLYERIRKPRVQRVRDFSRDSARGKDDMQGMKDYREFLASHDAVEHAKRELAEHLETWPTSI